MRWILQLFSRNWLFVETWRGVTIWQHFGRPKFWSGLKRFEFRCSVGITDPFFCCSHVYLRSFLVLAHAGDPQGIAGKINLLMQLICLQDIVCLYTSKKERMYDLCFFYPRAVFCSFHRNIYRGLYTKDKLQLHFRRYLEVQGTKERLNGPDLWDNPEIKSSCRCARYTTLIPRQSQFVWQCHTQQVNYGSK